MLLAGTLAATGVPAAAAPPPTANGSATESVIVVLRDQLGATPADKTHAGARASKARSAQQGVLNRVASDAKNVKHFTVGNAFSATVTKGQADALAADPAVASVSLDQPIPVSPPAASQSPTAAAQALAEPSPVSPQACTGTQAKPQLEPEALQTMNVQSDDPSAKTARALGIDGTGVKVAYIADGIDPQNKAFIRPNGQSAIVDYKDFYGDGPNAPTGGAEAFGDASSMVAQGTATYDVATFANPNVVTFPNNHCFIRIVGVAPGASLVALKAGSELLPNSAILQSIDYAVTVAHVDVLNESFGGNILPDTGTRNGIQLFNDQAVAAGTTVTVSTGDAGVTSTIGNPSTDPNVISAGASTDSRIYEQTGYAFATKFGNGKWLNDNISSLSSAGITQVGRTIDLSAPGEADWAACEASPNFSNCTSFAGTRADIQSFGGTSQSAPLTAGVAALVIQAYRKAHGGTSPTPALVKQLLTSTTRDLGLPGDEQGTGRIDARAAVEAALTYPGGSAAPAGVSSNVVLSTNQVTLNGAPGSNQTGTVRVTNVGTAPVTVSPSTRRYATVTSQTQQTTIDATSTQTTPYPTNAAPWVYKILTFDVPSGADELNARLLWKSGLPPSVTVPGVTPVVRVSLFTPDGTYAGNSRPQGGPRPANYALVQVRRPVAGTWTAVLYTPANTATAQGYTGPVTLQTDAERALPVGTISPSLFTLAPGASRTVSFTLPTNPVGGDAVYTASFGSSGGHQTALPVIVRSLVPTTNGVGTFTGTITGGNARSAFPGQKFNYAFDVPKDQKDLNVWVTPSKPGDTVVGTLVDPNGETPSIESNVTLNGGVAKSVVNTVANPQAGRWYYVLSVADPVSGNNLANPFQGKVAFNQIKVQAAGNVPAAGTTLKAGKPVSVSLVVTNPSPQAIFVQTDARTTQQQQLQLAPQFAGSTITLPLSVDELSDIPGYLVPPDTRRVALTASSTVPAQVELNSPLGGIDVFGDLRQAQGGETVSTATVSERAPYYVGQGYWFTYVQEIGPFGDGGAAPGTSTLVANAVTAGFDRAVTSSTGDPYLQAIDPTADPGKPVRIAPGGSAVITVTVTPNAKVGSTVKGVLNLVTTPNASNNVANTTGDVIAVLPYEYKVG